MNGIIDFWRCTIGIRKIDLWIKNFTAKSTQSSDFQIIRSQIKIVDDLASVKKTEDLKDSYEKLKMAWSRHGWEFNKQKSFIISKEVGSRKEFQELIKRGKLQREKDTMNLRAPIGTKHSNKTVSWRR